MNLPRLPSAITVRRYRSFVDPTRLELKPITLLFGVNNSGKSALLRLLPLLSASRGPQSAPLNLETPAARGATFGDLQSKLVTGTDADRDLELTFEWETSEGQVEAVRAALFLLPDWRRILARQLEFRRGERRDTFRWRYVEGEQHSQVLTYEWLNGGSPQDVKLRMQGLLGIDIAQGPASEVSRAFSEHLEELVGSVQWLSATRRLAAGRLRPSPQAPRWILSPDGEDTCDVLATNAEIRAEVSAWYEEAFERSIEIRPAPADHYQLLLRHLKEARLEVDISDCGEGLAQLLPILTAFSLGRRPDLGGPRILAIEEPESHLHPSLQVLLAEYLCRAIAERPEPCLVLETHSEQMLLGVQLQVVLGRLDPRHVVIYWVRQLDDGSSVANPIYLDDLGRPAGDALPPGVFEEGLEVSRRIVEARLPREGIQF